MEIKSPKSRMGLNKLLIKILDSQKVIVRLSVLAIFMSASSAFAAGIENTVTAFGTAPGGTVDAVQATDTENVDVENATPELVVTKTSPDSNVGVGDTVSYTYTVTNTGNITLQNVSLSDAHDGYGSSVTPSGLLLTDNGTPNDSSDDAADNTWDTLYPGDMVTWTASYTVVQADLNNNGGGDGDIDNTVTASATPLTGTLGGTLTADLAVSLQAQNPSLSVSKTADDDTDVVAGQTVTYTYVVENNGNVPISAISLTDSVTAGSGATPIPALDASSLEDNNTIGDSSDDAADNTYDVLGVGDKITYTGTYVVTQSDVDTLQ